MPRLIDADEFKRRALNYYPEYWDDVLDEMDAITIEPLTDEEQRIFLAAMGREKKLCENIDLLKVCREIERKVKRALFRKEAENGI